MVIMTQSFWQRLWRLVHSPLVLGPVLVITISISLAELPETIAKRGWMVGSVVGLAVVMGIFVTILDVVPRAWGWLVMLHRMIKRGVNAVEERLDRGTALLSQVFSDPPTNICPLSITSAHSTVGYIPLNLT